MSREDIVNLVKRKIENTVKLNLDYGVIAEYLVEALSLANNCGEESAFDLRTLYEQLKKIKG